jgi:hypothetical protein
MKPKFTDTHRYPKPYTPASATDITKSIKRERERLKKLDDDKADQYHHEDCVRDGDEELMRSVRAMDRREE